MIDAEMTLDDLFDEFYEAINGFAPYEWQRRLVRYVADRGAWPDLLDAPTGSGKTAVLEVHVFLNAFAGSLGISKNIPRRLIIAVNRRSLVDSQYLHAQEMSELLHQVFSGKADENGCFQTVLEQVAAGLACRWGESGKAASSDAGPLMVASMRGGSDAPNRSNQWRLYPEAPAIICATPDMIGSRLLFRGYGTSQMMRSVEAGLLANDSVLVIDEAHNNRQLVLTARRVSELERVAGVCKKSTIESTTNEANWGEFRKEAFIGAIACPLQVVESTATPANDCGSHRISNRVGIRKRDIESDKNLANRITKPKKLQLIPVNGNSAYAKQITDCALRAFEDRDGVVAVIVNTVKVAVAVERELCARLSSLGDSVNTPEIVCVLGRMRPFDRADAVRRLRELGDSDRRAFIVGTQALEVGLNYDCYTMVTELCPASALVQRLGRVNRFGRFPDGLAIVVEGGAKSKGPYEQKDLDEAREWVCKLEDRYPCGVSALDLAQIEVSNQTSRRSLYQRLEISDVDYLSHTSECLGAEEGVQTADGDRADLALWLRDELGKDSDRDVSLVVRAGLPSNVIDACDIVSRTPPLEEELFPCSYSTMRGVVKACWEKEKGQVDDRLADASLQNQPEQAFTLLASEDGQRFHPMGLSEQLIPGGVYVVDASAPVFYGPIVKPRGEGEQPDTACDVYNKIALREGVGNVPFLLNDDARNDVCAGDLSCAEELYSWETELKEAIVEAANDFSSGKTQTEIMDEFVEEAARRFPEGSAVLRVARNLEAMLVVCEDDVRVEDVVLIYHPDINSADVSRLEIGGSREVLLEEHSRATSNLARNIAQSVGLAPIYEEVVAIAGAHHDDGKSDPRFQRMLVGGRKPTRMLAKGKARSRSDVIRLYKSLGISGWRHEQLSAAITWNLLKSGEVFGTDSLTSGSDGSLSADVQQLIVRLVGTSHGRGRALYDSGAEGLCIDEDLSRNLDSAMKKLFDFGLWESIIARTDSLYGYWGVAYLEAIVRAADARESALEQGGDCR